MTTATRHGFDILSRMPRELERLSASSKPAPSRSAHAFALMVVTSALETALARATFTGSLAIPPPRDEPDDII
jgi:hypothetical protein